MPERIAPPVLKLEDKTKNTTFDLQSIEYVSDLIKNKQVTALGRTRREKNEGRRSSHKRRHPDGSNNKNNTNAGNPDRSSRKGRNQRNIHK